MARNLIGGPAMSLSALICDVECHAEGFFMSLSVRLYIHAKEQVKISQRSNGNNNDNQPPDSHIDGNVLERP